jgi:small subunit ribosomal protein S6
MAHLTSQRDVPGTQREYETIYILRPDASTEQIHDVNTRIRKVIESAEGKLIRVDNWGKRKLAYEIKKQLKGIYLYWLYLGGSQLVAEIERNLRMLDLVIRYYTVRVDEDVNPDARPSQMDEESFAATATTVPDEEDAYLGRVPDEPLGDSDDRTDGDHEPRKAQAAEAETKTEAETATEAATATATATEAEAETKTEATTEAKTEAAAEPAEPESKEE